MMLTDPRFQRTAKCSHYSKYLKETVDPRLEPFPIEYKDPQAISFIDWLSDSDFSVPFKFSAALPRPLGLLVPKKESNNMYSYLRSLAGKIGEGLPVKLMDVSGQKAIDGYTLGEYVNYLEKRSTSNKIINMITLELSKTAMACQVEGPELVRRFDWIDQVWPLNRRAIGDYPCVQRYCLTGMAGSFTDFHIDFGGTSVWYHVVFGKKRFYVIEPTLENLKKHEQWLSSKKQSSTFFGDLVSTKCMYVDINEGETFMIPSGWIHAVYTPNDSVVFGGNFLHSLSVSNQLRVSQVEQRTSIDAMSRFPNFKYLHFMVAASLFHPLRKAVMEKFANSANSLSYFPVNNVRKPYVFQELVVLLKTCEMWQKELDEEDKTAFPSVANAYNLNTSTFFMEWWMLLSNIAQLSEEKDTLSAILKDIKESKYFDIMNPLPFSKELNALVSQPADASGSDGHSAAGNDTNKTDSISASASASAAAGVGGSDGVKAKKAKDKDMDDNSDDYEDDDEDYLEEEEEDIVRPGKRNEKRKFVINEDLEEETFGARVKPQSEVKVKAKMSDLEMLLKKKRLKR